MSTLAAARYAKRYKLDYERGLRRTTPAAPAVAHVRALLAVGVSQATIAAAAGVSPNVITYILTGQQTGLRVTTARALLALTPAQVIASAGAQRREGFVPAVGARRRIQALMAIGWPHADITAHMREHGVATKSQLVLHQAGAWITKPVHDAIDATFRDLAMQPGPNVTTRKRARAAGYMPPLAWDEDTIDLPDAVPNLGMNAPVKGGVTADDRLDDWLHLVRSGEDHIRAARRAGYHAADAIGAIRTAAHRIGRDDVLTVLDQAATFAHAERVHVVPTETPAQRARRRTTTRSTAAA